MNSTHDVPTPRAKRRSNPGEVGALKELSDRKREIERLQREIERLNKKLWQAEIIIEVQKNGLYT